MKLIPYQQKIFNRDAWKIRKLDLLVTEKRRVSEEDERLTGELVQNVTVKKNESEEGP